MAQVLRTQPHHRRMVDAQAAQFDRQRLASVQHHLVGVVVDAPGGEQPRQRRLVVVGYAVGVDEGCIVHLGQGIDEHQQAAAAEYILVQRIERFVAQVLGMDQDHHLDRRVDHLQAACVDHPHIEQLAHLPHDRPGLFADQRIAVDRQARHHADHRAGAAAEFIHELGHVVFEEGLAGRIEIRQGQRVVHRRVGQAPAHQAKEHALAVAAAGHGVQAGAFGGVLVVGIRHRVDHPQADASVAARGNLAQHFAHALLVAAQLRQVARGVVGEIHSKLDRLLHAVNNAERARRKRVEVIGGEVHPRRAHGPSTDQHHQDEQRGQGDDAQPYPQTPIGDQVHRLHRARR